MNSEKLGDINLVELKQESQSLKSGLGVIAWAVLEMFKRGGMPANEIAKIQEQMNTYFAKPSNDECNAVLKVVESRLADDKEAKTNLWYS